MSKKSSAFTLIEILVVVSIMGLLIAILLPSLNAARTQAKRVTCASQLHQIAVAMMEYMHDSRDRMPFVSSMPSLGPAPLDTEKPIYFPDALKQQLAGNKNVFQCPNDRPDTRDTPRAVPNTGLSFFQSERSSYGYREDLGGLTPALFAKRNQPGVSPLWHPQHRHHHETNTKTPPNTIWFAVDFDNFHGKAGEIGARRYAYIDGHVSDYEN